MSDFYFFPKRFSRAPAPVKRMIWRAEAVLVGGTLGCFRCLPYTLGHRLARTIFSTLGGYTERAAQVQRNLGVVFPDASTGRRRRLTRATFGHLGMAMAELASVDRVWRARRQRLEFVEHPGAQVPSPEHRSVFVTAHTGAWEFTPLIGPHYAIDLPIIYAPERNPYVDKRLAKFRAGYGSRLIVNKGGVRTLMRALDSGASVGLTADTRMDAGESLTFFGEQAHTNTTPARLALRYGCNMVPVRAERLPGGRYRIHIYPPIIADTACADTTERARDMTNQLNRLFEDWIRTMPGEWLCMKRRWPQLVYQRLGLDNQG